MSSIANCVVWNLARALSSRRQSFIADISNKHATWAVSDDERRFGRHQHGLGRNAACPEYGNLTVPNVDRVSEIGLSNVSYSDPFRHGQVNGSTMNIWEARCNLNRTNRLAGCHRSHGDNDWAVKHSRFLALNVRFEHRHIYTLFNVPHGNLGPQQCGLERKGTPNHEAHEVIAPAVANIGWFVDEFAILPNSVSWQIGLEIGSRGDASRVGPPASVTSRTGQGFGFLRQKSRKS